MNNIGLRFDGILIGAFLALVVAIFALFALWLGGSALFATGERRGYLMRVARTSAGYAAVSLLGSLMVAAYARRGGPPTGPDLIDWVTVPAAVLFAIGCRRLTRRRAGDRSGERRTTVENS
jgi:hypothetical protein